MNSYFNLKFYIENNEINLEKIKQTINYHFPQPIPNYIYLFYGKNFKFQFNNEKNLNNIAGPAFESKKIKKYFINGIQFNESEFGYKTGHLLCKYCYNFCKQSCFI